MSNQTTSKKPKKSVLNKMVELVSPSSSIELNNETPAPKKAKTSVAKKVKLPVASSTLTQKVIERKLNQTQIANLIGVHPSTVSRLVNGKSGFTLNTDLRLSKLFNETAGTFFTQQTEERLPIVKKQLSDILKGIKPVRAVKA